MKYLGILFLFAIAPYLEAQVLSDFTARQNGDHVELRWTFNSGETCNGTHVKHGTDPAEMKLIHYVPGICGAPDHEVSYSYIHKNAAKNDTNYYSLVLGTRGNSSTINIYVDAVDNGFIIQGQPLNDYAEILLSQKYQQGAEIIIFDVKGKKKYQKSIKTREIRIYREELNSGMHIIIVRYKNGKSFKRKLMVL